MFKEKLIDYKNKITKLKQGVDYYKIKLEYFKEDK